MEDFESYLLEAEIEDRREEERMQEAEDRFLMEEFA